VKPEPGGSAPFFRQCGAAPYLRRRGLWQKQFAGRIARRQGNIFCEKVRQNLTNGGCKA